MAGVQTQEQMGRALALIPERFHATGADRYQTWADATVPIFGHVFLHANWLHAGLNAFFFFGAARWPALRLGAWRFLAVFFASAALGAVFFLAINWNEEGIAVGASSAVCGVFTAYLFSMRPRWRDALAEPAIRNQLVTLIFINVVLMGFAAEAGWLPIAWEAHLGGFVGGGLAYVALERRWPLTES
jgi:membrane associated rhomboid family serine protease